MVWEGLYNKRLERILPEWEGPLISLYLVTPASSARPTRVTALLDYLVKAFEHSPWAAPCAGLPPEAASSTV